MDTTSIDQFSFENNEDCTSVMKVIIKFMEGSIQKGFFSRSSLTYDSTWKPDYTILVFQEILQQRLTIENVEFPIIEDFTLVGNKQVKFTITSEFFEFYLSKTAI
tara:strand:- start:1136 stop:1450 length:315 start_codon:yes stop_codon:yes gene_type:complete